MVTLDAVYRDDVARFVYPADASLSSEMFSGWCFPLLRRLAPPFSDRASAAAEHPPASSTAATRTVNSDDCKRKTFFMSYVCGS